MNNKPTPETDASTFHINDDNFSPVVNQAVARKLERERDETRNELEAAMMELGYAKSRQAELLKERDQLRKVVDELAWRLRDRQVMLLGHDPKGCPCDPCKALERYNNLPHVKERNKP